MKITLFVLFALFACSMAGYLSPYVGHAYGYGHAVPVAKSYSSIHHVAPVAHHGYALPHGHGHGLYGYGLHGLGHGYGYGPHGYGHGLGHGYGHGAYGHGPGHGLGYHA